MAPEATTLQGVFETILQPIYDSTSLATGGVQAVFFTQPKGSGTSVWGGTGVKNLADTNMRVAGSLQAMNSFVVRGIALQFSVSISLADLKAIAQAGALTLTVGAKPQLEVPIAMLTGGGGIWSAIGTQTAAATNEVSHLGEADPRSIFAVDPGINLLANQSFSATVDWATGPTLSATAPMRLVLHGWLSRPAQ